MQAVILAGGKGTRLHPYTTVLPKPLVPIGERPILELIMHQLANGGFNQVDLCVGHLGELIRAYLAGSSGIPKDMKLNFMFEDEPLGTAGALHQLPRPEAPFLVMNGDILTGLDFGDLMAHHLSNDAALTIATYKKDVQLSLGVIEGEGDEVSDYIEKPTLSYDVSMGIYIYDPRALDHVPEARFDFPDLVLALIAAGEKVIRYPFSGAWYDIGTRDEHEKAVAAFTGDPVRFDESRG